MPKKKQPESKKHDDPNVMGLRAEVLEQPICQTLESNYMPYAMSVIVSRAIPEIDGFKPSHRKLLYTMYEMGLLTKPRTKSANIVGQTMKLNPHGDAAIYETMVRLARGNETQLHPFVDSKGTFGKVYCLCGAVGYTGAPVLAASAAVRSGSGLVFLGVPESIYGFEAVKLNEPVIFPLPDAGGRLSADAVPEILTRLPQMDAVLVGPGLGQSEGTLAVVRAVLENAQCPVVVDADGINVLSAHRDLLRGRKLPTILPPHDGEFARLGGVIGEDRMAAAAALAEELGCVVLLKGHETCITDGVNGYCNPTGNPGMAVGGSGDVLAGMTSALLACKLPAFEAAVCAVYLHGAAADCAAAKHGETGMLPHDLFAELGGLFAANGR